ncbi:hypothetical protein DITRI_Ditri14bG0084700 [Diplodiscus trichospermus]
MGKKMREKDGHKWENNQVEGGNAIEKVSDVLGVSTWNMNDVSESSNIDDTKNKRKEYTNEKKKDKIKKRKSEFVTYEKEYQKARKKHKKSKNVVDEVKEISMENCLGGKENTCHDSSEAMWSENNFDCEAKKVRKDKHKNNNRDGIYAVTETFAHSKMQEPGELQKICSTADTSNMVHGKEGEYEKRKKKKKLKLEKVSGNVAGHITVMSSLTYGKDINKEDSAGNKVECRKFGVDVGDAGDGNRGREKKSKSAKNDSEGKHHKGDARTRKSVTITSKSKNATPKDGSKKVSFSDHVEVFPCADVVGNANKDGKEGLVYARRYSKEEDEIIINAMADYIDSHNLGHEGPNMVMNCRLHPQLKNCWKEIQSAIPWRPLGSVYRRAHVLFERDEKRRWTPEEYEIVQKFVEEHGPKWRLLADSLGKHRQHVKDTWCRIKLTNTNRGNWSQEEYQKLFDLVNMDLSMKAFKEKISKHGMLRDNICWTAISDRMQTRPFATCCVKWYGSLASPLVAKGIWTNTDDYHMLEALSRLDACCMEDVDWDNLIEHRSGDLCRKWWNQMVRHLGQHRDKSFAEQVEILANRYRPDLLDARETYDSKRPVDQP